jgi:vacuolar-type H+-ATPase subunit E/Vma4
MTLQSKEVENGDKPNEVGTGRISRKTADAISPSVLNNHTEQLESLTASFKEIASALKSQVELNGKFDARLTALEKAVKALQEASKPLPVVTTKPKADALQEVIDLVNSGEATIAPKKESKPKASKKKTTSSLENTMALLFS